MSATQKVFVVTEDEDEEIVAYHAWCMAQVHVADAPQRLRRGGRRFS